MKIALFSSYSETNIIHNYIKSYLEQLAGISDKVVFLTNNTRIITNEDLSFLMALNIEVCYLDNGGYDFGMYYKYIANNLPLFDKCNHLIICNDSCILFRDISPFIHRFYYGDADVYGFTSSIELTFHIQSYFMAMKSSAIKLFISYIMEHGIYEDKRNVILNYELGLSSLFIDKGMKLKIEFPFENYGSVQVNSILVYPQYLIINGIPLIKKRTLISNFKPDEIIYLQAKHYNFSFDFRTYIKPYILADKKFSYEFLTEGI